MIKKIDHLVITTEKIKECLAFYEKIGFRAVDSGGRYELYGGDCKINVHCKGAELSPHAKVVTPGSADMCFEIEGSLTQCKDQLECNGIIVELGIVERKGTFGLMRSIYMRDPDYNLVELCSYE